MRKWIKAAAITACIAVLLAGCGAKPPAESSQQPEEEPVQETPAETEPVITVPTLAELRTANDPVEVLKGHQTVSVVMEARDGFGELTASGEILYHRDTAGALEMDSRTQYFEDGASSWTYAKAYSAVADPFYPGSGTPGAYYFDDGSNVYMTCVPAAEYETKVARELPPFSTGALDPSETITDCAEQDGALVVTTRSSIVELDVAWETDYYVEPENGLLLAMAITNYDSTADDAAVTDTTRWNWTYDGDYKMDWSYPNIGRISADDACELTLVIDPGKEEQEIQHFGIAKGTTVTFEPEEPYTLYLDEALTKEAPSYFMDTNRDSVTYYAVCGTGAEA